jgi:Pyruvate/2-oxoacid:ferredoxin oxidoreductase delta subunit
MIVDLDEYFKPRLTIVDAVECMEGNGPTGGTPRHMGALLAGENPHKVDLVCAGLIGLNREEVPTLEAALERGLIPASADELTVEGDPAAFAIPDFGRIVTGNSHLFRGNGKSLRGRLTGAALEKLLAQRPTLKRDKCVGCGVCQGICPVKAISMEDKKPQIDRKKCIRCFCCQEFCPQSAMVVHRTAIAKLLDR